MKKYITLAALLAAGTTFANADESALPLLSLDMISSWDSIPLSTPSGSHTAGNSGFVWTGGDSLTESWKLSFSWAVSSGNQNRSSFELFGTNGGNAAYGIVIKYKDGALCIVDRDYNNGTPIESTICQISDVSLSTSAQSVTIAYLASNDTKYSSTLVLQLGDTVVSGAAPSSDTTFIGANGATRIWANGNPNGKDLFSEIKLYSASSVPEPSAFGLLAGVGALALVASRRRRK